MAHWKKVFTRITSNADDKFDRLKYRLRQRLNQLGPVMILPYRGFGNANEIYLKGRVLKDKGILSAEDNDTVWQNLLATYKRFASVEIPHVRVQARFAGETQEVMTDKEGYFEVRIKPREALPVAHAWHEVELELLDQVHPGQDTVKATGFVVTPTIGSQFGIISDVDDTILQTNATSMLKAAQLTFLNNARTRLPFEGVAAFYRALQSGPNSSLFNPIFYVSSSSWNLYDLLVDFCIVQGIPKGPLMLRDLGVEVGQFIKSSHHNHKFDQIKLIMETCENLPFVLIGDSGQHDPEIYMEVIKTFPKRIKAVYIRDVSQDIRDVSVQEIILKAKELGVDMLLVPDTVAAAKHAASLKLIDPEIIPDIRAEKEEDQQAPGPVEQLLSSEE
jgi:phosphatidate phosphatase APP1